MTVNSSKLLLKPEDKNELYLLRILGIKSTLGGFLEDFQRRKVMYDISEG